MLKKKVGWYLSLGALAVASVIAIAHAATIVYNANLTNETALAYNNTYVLDLQAAGVTSLSAQAVYSSATVASQAFQDGTQSTGSFTVANNGGLSTATATNNVTVVDNTGLSNASLVLPGYVFREGVDWAVRDVSSNTAESIKLALATVPGLGVSRAAGSAIVYATAPAYGTFYNSWTFTSSTPTALSVATPNFQGGQDNAVVYLNGVRMKQGFDWTKGASASASATALAAAINANTLLNKYVKVGASGAVVTATSTLAGVNNFTLTTSSPTAISVNNPAMTGGTAPSFALSGKITIPNHGFTLALPVLYSPSPSLTIGGLTDQTTYYVVPVDANTIGLSSTSVVAVSGVYKTFTSSTTQLAADTGTLAPLPITGIPSFKWQVSNDNVNWSDVAVSSVTMGATGTAYSIPPSNTLWSFGYIGPRFLRANVIAPTTGGIQLKIVVVGTN